MVRCKADCCVKLVQSHLMGRCVMKSAILYTSSGPIVVITCCESLTAPRFLSNLAKKGIGKFLAFELPIDLVRERYGNHYRLVCEDLLETDELRVLDYDGHRIMSLFTFSEYGPPIFGEVPQEMMAI